MIQQDKDFDFFINGDFSKYSGEWIAIGNRKVVAHNKSLKKLINSVKSKKNILFSKITKKRIICRFRFV